MGRNRWLLTCTVPQQLCISRWRNAAALFSRLGSAADKCNAINSQCKAYLSAIIIYLYTHDFQQAQKCYNDCLEVQAFLNSDQNRCAMKLLSAYEEDDAKEIKRIAQSSAFNHLDHVAKSQAKGYLMQQPYTSHSKLRKKTPGAALRNKKEIISVVCQSSDNFFDRQLQAI
uniref:Gamma-soluble NSF attachment protein n=1 Tax=Zea mays TaxID=4577 RepID=A0A804UA39_MAIZE